MPTGPQGQRRSAEAIGNAGMVMRIATEEEPEDYSLAGLEKDEATVAMGKKVALRLAMAAGVSDRLWSMEDVAALVEAPAPGKRGPYKKRETAAVG